MQSKVIAFWSPGSAGVSTLVANVGAFLGRWTNLRVAAVDFNFSAPSLALMLGLFREHTPLEHCFSALIPGLTAETLTPESLADELLPVRQAPSLRVLAGLFRPLALSLITPSHVERTLTLLRDQFDLILVDLPAPIDYTSTYVTLEQADQVIWLTSGYVADRFHLRRYLAASRELGLPAEKGALVLNRPGPATLRQIEFEFGSPVLAEIPACPSLAQLAEEGIIPALTDRHHADLRAFRKRIERVARLIAPEFEQNQTPVRRLLSGR